MDETLKYFKLHGLNNDTKNEIIIACKPEEIALVTNSYAKQGITLEECECPKNATMVTMPPKPYEPPKMPDIDFYDPFSHSAIYDGPCCGRCANRFKHSDFCTRNFQTNNCYRFKLEK